MFKKLLELRQQKAKLAEDMRNLLTTAETEKRSLTDEESKTFDELRNKATTLNADIARYESLADEERSQGGQMVETTSQPQVSNEELRRYIKTGELRSLSTTAKDDGGYSMIPQLDKQVMTRLTDDSVMRQICNVVRLPIGAKEYKKLVSAGGAKVKHGEEGQARTETNTPKLHEVTIALNSIYAYPKTTQEILDFSSIDVLGWLIDEISETFTETEETDLIEGDGDKKAKGLLTYTRATTPDKTRALGTLQKLTNKNGDYIWRDGLTAGAPATLLGLPVQYLETMPAGGAGKAVIALGDFKRGYFIVDHETGIRTRPDNITEPGFYKVHTDKYLGGGVVDSNAIKFVETKA